MIMIWVHFSVLHQNRSSNTEVLLVLVGRGGLPNTHLLYSLLSDTSTSLSEKEVSSGPAVFLYSRALTDARRWSTGDRRAAGEEPANNPTAGRATQGTERAPLPLRKDVGAGSKGPDFKPSPQHSLAGRPQASDLTALCLSSLT